MLQILVRGGGRIAMSKKLFCSIRRGGEGEKGEKNFEQKIFCSIWRKLE